MDWVDRPRNYKGLYGILQLLQGSHLDIFPQKTLKLGRVAFIHQHFSFNVKIFNLIDIRNSPQCPHVSAMGKSFTSNEIFTLVLKPRVTILQWHDFDSKSFSV